MSVQSQPLSGWADDSYHAAGDGDGDHNARLSVIT
jgi:hypothetical protein